MHMPSIPNGYCLSARYKMADAKIIEWLMISYACIAYRYASAIYDLYVAPEGA